LMRRLRMGCCLLTMKMDWLEISLVIFQDG
jgi:hypothetical protein